MDHDLKKLMQELGELLEGLGQTMQGDAAYTPQGMTEVRDTLSRCAEITQTVRDIAFPVKIY